MNPLWRNRDFLVLETGRLLSNGGTQITAIAYPLLVLALTGSPAKAGIVQFCSVIPYAIFALPAGVIADRYNRKTMMIASDCLRAATIATLAGLLLFAKPEFWLIPLVAFIEGSGATVFLIGYNGALKAVVPKEQLPAAIAAQRGRMAVVRLLSPPAGGALFALGRSIPFITDAASYAFSVFSLGLMRTPFQEEREVDRAPLRSQLADGFRFLWSNSFIRATTLIYAIGNVSISAVLLMLVVLGRRQGLSSGEIGGLVAVFGGCLLLGSVLSNWFRRRFSMRAIILIELWASLGIALYLAWPSVWVLLAGMCIQGITMPVTDSVVISYRIAVTPEKVLGRAESVRSNISLLLGPFGPLLAGFLLAAVSARAAVAVFFGWNVALLSWAFIGPAIRNAPNLEEALQAGSGA